MNNAKGYFSQFAISDEEFQNRLANVRKQMENAKIDLLIVAGDEHYQGHIRYLSDYRPILEYALIIISFEADPILLCGPECKDLAVQTSRVKDIRVCADVAIPGEEYPNETMCTFIETLSDIDRNNTISRIGVVNLDLIPSFLYRSILSACGNREVINASLLIDKLRGIKSEREIEIMRYTYKMGKAGLNAGIDVLHTGKSETDVVAAMSLPMYMMGAEQMSHCFYAGSGRNSSPALNFSMAEKDIEDGDLVVLDVGAVFHGYFSDIATTRIAGKVDKNKARVLDTAIRALDAAISVIKPGIKGKDIDLAARRISSEAGYVKNHLYGAVHGVGLQHCEYPFFGPTTETFVEEGMFFNIDIGLFGFDFGGVRVENGILVTAGGCEVFAVEHCR